MCSVSLGWSLCWLIASATPLDSRSGIILWQTEMWIITSSDGIRKPLTIHTEPVEVSSVRLQSLGRIKRKRASYTCIICQPPRTGRTMSYQFDLPYILYTRDPPRHRFLHHSPVRSIWTTSNTKISTPSTQVSAPGKQVLGVQPFGINTSQSQ